MAKKLPNARRRGKCAAQLFGTWAVQEDWFRRAVEMAKGIDVVELQRLNAERAKAQDDGDEDDPMPGPMYDTDENGIAHIVCSGPITKYQTSFQSMFGGASTVMLQRAIREARKDSNVKGIVIEIDSPGGTVAGVGDVAEEIRRTRQEKPVCAYIADLGASAAYWIASACDRIYANESAQVGSIGVYAVLEDSTARQAMDGIKLTVVATAANKGLGADGAVTPELVADVRREINDINGLFTDSVVRGRPNLKDTIAGLADGRVHIAGKAKEMGLIDEVCTFDDAMQAMTEDKRMNTDSYRTYAAEHPDDEAVKEQLSNGYKAGIADGAKAERDRMAAIFAACGKRRDMAVASVAAGHDVETVKLMVIAADQAEADAAREADALKAAIAAKDAELAKLQANIGVQGAIGTAGAAVEPEPAKASEDELSSLDPEARAKIEWAQMSEVDRAKLKLTETAYIRYRKAELSGRIRKLSKSE